MESIRKAPRFWWPFSRRKNAWNPQVIIPEVVLYHPILASIRGRGKENKLNTDVLLVAPGIGILLDVFSLGLGVVFWKHAKERKRPHFFCVCCVIQCVCFCLGMVVWRQRDVVFQETWFPVPQKKDMGSFLLTFFQLKQARVVAGFF